jgi:hypothetical protein
MAKPIPLLPPAIKAQGETLLLSGDTITGSVSCVETGLVRSMELMVISPSIG